MKIFIDSADLDEIHQFYSWGLADGVTTNPSLLKKAVEQRKKAGEKINLESYIKAILKTAQGTPVSLEVTETTAKSMVAQGKALYKRFNAVAKNVYIKIPINPSFTEQDQNHFEGIAAIRELTLAKIPVNCTLIFTPEQALMAAKAGAAFVSPFAGRVDDYLRDTAGMKAGVDYQKSDYYPQEGNSDTHGKKREDNGIVSGIQLVQQCVQILGHYHLKTEVLAASLRNTRQVREAALAGAHIVTLPFSVAQDLLKHEKTREGMKLFTADSKSVPEYEKLMKK